MRRRKAKKQKGKAIETELRKEEENQNPKNNRHPRTAPFPEVDGRLIA